MYVYYTNYRYVYIYIYTYTSNTASKITIHKVPKPHPTKTHLMIDVWSHFITGCHCFLLQLQLPFSHMPRLSRTHQSSGHHEKTHGRKVTRSTGEPFGNLLEGHRRFLFGTSAAFIRGIHNGPQASYQIDLPLHMVQKKRNTIKILSFRTTIGKKKWHVPFWRATPSFCFPPHPFFWEKKHNIPPLFQWKTFQLWDPWGESTPSLVEKKSTSLEVQDT